GRMSRGGVRGKEKRTGAGPALEAAAAGRARPAVRRDPVAERGRCAHETPAGRGRVVAFGDPFAVDEEAHVNSGTCLENVRPMHHVDAKFEFTALSFSSPECEVHLTLWRRAGGAR